MKERHDGGAERDIGLLVSQQVGLKAIASGGMTDEKVKVMLGSKEARVKVRQDEGGGGRDGRTGSRHGLHRG